MDRSDKTPIPFGEAFGKYTRLALLALPGGGKTVLLKRLTVAYADPARRHASADHLPDLDLTPVVIRCREWRQHIHQPISTLLRNLPDITGQPSLAGVSDALNPLFAEGRALLLVDGLDEIHDDALRSTFVEHLETFLEEFASTRVVITSREAGFSLVAPTIARFCRRWRVAPLSSEAIQALCQHWHRLMTGNDAEAETESRKVADNIQGSEPIRRLAENPLLLTMLLVVKHGAGRLPPDRVSLYSRAVEILLDTWNIKGHAPLNVKEALPQLAFIAFQLMRAGRQTATEKELLTLLEEARERVPQIRRYAKDTPYEFLRRVELRSSLIIEAGHQKEDGRNVPFYQFRHLTFQEYLAAVAVVEGHYADYDKSHTIVTPLMPHLTSAEWKEVIPMSSVIARKQAEPLMRALVEEGMHVRRGLDYHSKESSQPRQHSTEVARLPPAVSRLLQCLLEEAEATPDTLIQALRLIAFFADRNSTPETALATLSRGPYGEEALQQSWIVFKAESECPEKLDRPLFVVGSALVTLAGHRRPEEYWKSLEGTAVLTELLESDSDDDAGVGLATCIGLIFRSEDRTTWTESLPLRLIETLVFRDNPAVCFLAIWSVALICNSAPSPPQTSPTVLDRVLAIFLSALSRREVDKITLAEFAFASQIGLSRKAWRPFLAADEIMLLQAQAEHKHGSGEDGFNRYAEGALAVIAYHGEAVLSDTEIVLRLRTFLSQTSEDSHSRTRTKALLAELTGTTENSVVEE